MRPRYLWYTTRRQVELGSRTLLMGVINVTPDSFSDGGQFFSPESATRHALRLLDEGADILDIGGESTRPGASVASRDAGGSPVEDKDTVEGSATAAGAVGAQEVDAQEELRRVLPVIEAVKAARPEAIVSVDTYKSEVARQAVRAGAEIVNDVSGLTWDADMASTLAGLDCGVVLMHTRGHPAQWPTLPPVADVVELVSRELEQRALAAEAAGIGRRHIVLDPGFGFGKRLEENYPLLARLRELHSLGFPLLAGTSRKSFIGKTVSRSGTPLPPEQRLYGTLATVAACILEGAHIVRVHDVAPAWQAAAVADAILNSGRP